MLKRFLLCLTLTLMVSIWIPIPAHAATAIDARYTAEAELRTLLGAPISPESPVENGRLRHYERGTLYWSASSGVHEVHGAIRDRYRASGGVQTFGFPTSDETSVWVRYEDNQIGRVSNFENGAVTIDREGSTHIMSRTVADEWAGSEADFLMPAADEESVPAGKRVRFQSGSAIYATGSGAHEVHDYFHGVDIRIDEKYGAKGGAWGLLGLPVSDYQILDFEEGGEYDGAVQVFARGRIYWQGDGELDLAAPNAYEVHGPILSRYLAEGGPEILGFPVSDQQPFEDAQRSRFEHADIILYGDGQTLVVAH